MYQSSESFKRSVDREGMVEIDVVGRHALLFDDDATAAFVNSKDALVEWNSLLIDRYDVRHLLSGPPPSRRRRNQQKPQSPRSLSSIDSELDHERYLDLPPPSDEQGTFHSLHIHFQLIIYEYESIVGFLCLDCFCGMLFGSNLAMVVILAFFFWNTDLRLSKHKLLEKKRLS